MPDFEREAYMNLVIKDLKNQEENSRQSQKMRGPKPI